MKQAALAVALLVPSMVAITSAASAQVYEIPWWTVDAGGAQAVSGGTFDLSATSGQPDAGGPYAGGSYVVSGGFWASAAGGAGPVADLSITKTDGLTSAVPGQPLTYTISASNAGPDPVAGASVTDTLPASLLGATWTCVGSGGGACAASGSGSIVDTVTLPVAATVTYTLTATVDPSTVGSLSNTASVAVPAGVSDPDPADNSATDTDTLTPQADLALAVTDAPDPVAAGAALTYTIQITNLGASSATGMTLVDTLPAGVAFVSSTPGAPTCTEAGGTVTCTLAGLAPGASQAVTILVDVSPAATGSLSDTATVVGNEPDPVSGNDADTESTAVLAVQAEGELGHGSSLWTDLDSLGGLVDVDLYRISQKPYSSYEVVVDGTSADIGTGLGPKLDRLASDGATILQSSATAGAGASRALRFENDTASPVDDQYVRVLSAGCTTTCGPEDVYRIRAYDTTLRLARFNNSATQITILVLQNPGSATVTGQAHFWDTTGTLRGTQAFTLGAHAASVVNTAGIPGLAGMSGTITVSQDGGYGALTGKAVALETATGFTFDTPLEPRGH